MVACGKIEPSGGKRGVKLMADDELSIEIEVVLFMYDAHKHRPRGFVVFLFVFAFIIVREEKLLNATSMFSKLFLALISLRIEMGK